MATPPTEARKRVTLAAAGLAERLSMSSRLAVVVGVARSLAALGKLYGGITASDVILARAPASADEDAARPLLPRDVTLARRKRRPFPAGAGVDASSANDAELANFAKSLGCEALLPAAGGATAALAGWPGGTLGAPAAGSAHEQRLAAVEDAMRWQNVVVDALCACQALLGARLVALERAGAATAATTASAATARPATASAATARPATASAATARPATVPTDATRPLAPVHGGVASGSGDSSVLLRPRAEHDMDLVGCTGEMDAIVHAFSAVPPNGACRYLLCGPSGVGKSTLAREAALRLSEAGAGFSVYYELHGRSATAFEQSLAAFGRALGAEIGLAGDMPDDDVRQRVRSWLACNPPHRRWMLIVDDVCEDAVASMQELLVMPKTGRGCVLFTSRMLPDAAGSLGARLACSHVRRLGLFDVGLARELLVKLKIPQVVLGDARLDGYLRDVLGLKPIAVRVFGEVVRRLGADAALLGSLMQSDEAWQLLTDPNKLSVRGEYGTARVVLHELERAGARQARMLIGVLAHCTPNAVAECLFEGAAVQAGLDQVRQCGLASVGAGEIGLHQTIQAAVRICMQQDGALAQDVRSAVEEILRVRLSANFEADKEARTQLRPMTCELESLVDYCLHHVSTLGGAGLARARLARSLCALGEYQRALCAAQRACDELRAVSEGPSVLLVETQRLLAGLLNHAGQAAQAAGVLRAVIEGYAGLYGLQDRRVADVLIDLSAAELAAGRRAAALNQAEAAVQMLGELDNGDDDDDDSAIAGRSDFLRARHQLASVLAERGDYERALGEFEFVLESFRKSLGETHPDTLTTRYNIANMKQYRGDYAPAIGEYEAVLAMRISVLGAMHPDTLATRLSLAATHGTFGAQARSAEAALPLIRACVASLESLGSLFRGQVVQSWCAFAGSCVLANRCGDILPFVPSIVLAAAAASEGVADAQRRVSLALALRVCSHIFLRCGHYARARDLLAKFAKLVDAHAGLREICGQAIPCCSGQPEVTYDAAACASTLVRIDKLLARRAAGVADPPLPPATGASST